MVNSFSVSSLPVVYLIFVVCLQSINQTTEDQIGTFREFSQIYNKMSDICFNLCVWDFGTDQVKFCLNFRQLGQFVNSSSSMFQPNFKCWFQCGSGSSFFISVRIQGDKPMRIRSLVRLCRHKKLGTYLLGYTCR